jgi:hypothetical protein
MSMRATVISFGATAVVAVGFAAYVFAAPPAQNAGQSGSMSGDVGAIHELLANHDRITRTVTNLPNGIKTLTESADPEIAKTIKEHVENMGKLVQSGKDPGLPMATATVRALFENYDKIKTTYEITSTGVVVTQTSSDAHTVALLQQHAAEVTGLVKEGMVAAHRAMMESSGGMGTPGMSGGMAHAADGDAQMAGMNHRGATVMGFDQEKTTHHFYLYEDGGAIDVSVNDAADAANRDAIRSHLPHIATLFGQGNFEAPMAVHDTKTVPGTAEMASLKDKISYRYVESSTGGRVDIVTRDAAALKALHQFLRFQIADHKTGDSVDVKKR